MSFPIDIESMLGPFGDPQTRRLAEEVIELRKQVALDRQSRAASQAEFALLNRELNEAKETARKPATMYDETSKALGEARLEIAQLEQTVNR